MRSLKNLSIVGLLSVLAACGGVAGGSSTSSPPPVGGTPARVDLVTSGALTTISTGSVTITAQVVSSTSAAIGGQAVLFSADSGVLGAASVTSSSSGVATVTLTGGANKSNRTITVTATCGGVSGTVSVAVSGTTLAVSGVSSLLVGGSASTYSVQARDAGNGAVANQVLTVKSASGNTLSASSITTDSSGNATFTVTPSVSGSDTLTVAGLGTTASSAVTVSATNFTVTAPATSGTSVPVNAPGTTFSVKYLSGGVAQSGVTVNFSTTRGSLSASSATTDASGVATVTVQSASAGPATLTASIASASASVSTAVLFAAITPSAIKLQATPSAVSPNSSGGTGNQSTLLATVTDASANPVFGATVDFSVVSDSSGGSISTPSATTDSNGQARSAYVPGATSTATNGVVLSATVSGTSVSSTTNLTVSGQALFITIGYGNKVRTDVNITNYIKDFSVYVADANGAAVTGQVLTLAVYPNNYGKGYLYFPPTGSSSWIPKTLTVCANEDLNKNGILDPGEDINGNVKLDPGLPIVVSPSTVTTDVTGHASFTLTYGESFTSWLFNIDISAAGTVSGTESKTTLTVPGLWGLAVDYSNSSTAPADVFSPFGQATVCTSPL
jgi:hypothetical protein